MKIYILSICIAVLLVGCASVPIELSDAAMKVKVVKSDPPNNYAEIGPITASDGGGCGGFGTRGNYDNAMLVLKSLAVEKGGDYVQIMTLSEPHSEGGCYVNAYTISGTLFKKTNELPTTSLATSSNKPSATSRLKELDELRKNGAINDNEYAVKRKEIIKSL